jgi:hypothetical protein
MKPRTKAFADALLKDPSKSQTQAYIDTHDTNNHETAKVQGSKLANKPTVRIYMKKHEEKAKRRIAEMLDSDKPDMVLKAATDILDRNLGKAIQRSVSENTNLNLNIEASKEMADNFTEFLRQNTSI